MDRPQETSHDVILTKRKTSHRLQRQERETDGDTFVLDMWILVPTIRTKNRKAWILHGSFHSEDLNPRPDPPDKHVTGERRNDIMSHDEDVVTVNVDGEALEQEMEELEDDAERVKNISKPKQPSKKEREEHHNSAGVGNNDGILFPITRQSTRNYSACRQGNPCQDN